MPGPFCAGIERVGRRIADSASRAAPLRALFDRQVAQGEPQLFASVANYGTAERGVIISFYSDGQLFSAEQLAVPA